MYYLFTIVKVISIINVMVIIDFTQNSSLENWNILNDDVMGGVSQSNFTVNEAGNAVFEGSVSLENNGGFCSVHYISKEINAFGYETVMFRIKGDGKRYQFRIKADQKDYYSYASYFTTSGNWETLEIKLKDMYPVFRGRKLDMPNFSHNTISEIAFLIGNNKEENFQLEIEKIELK